MKSVYETIWNACARDHAFISVSGSGGKTTLLIGLARYCANIGKSVLLTTTTKLRSPYIQDYGAHVIYDCDSVLSHKPKAGEVVFYALENKETGKWTCPPIENLEVLKERFDVVINEADGSRCLPVKVHTERDPVIPHFTTYTVSVFGLWAIGQRTPEVAFGEKRDLVVDFTYLAWLLSDSQGILKGSIENHRAIVFNGADVHQDFDVVRALDFPSDALVLAASLREDSLYDKIQ